MLLFLVEKRVVNRFAPGGRSSRAAGGIAVSYKRKQE
jgi:hypothetical protein